MERPVHGNFDPGLTLEKGPTKNDFRGRLIIGSTKSGYIDYF